MDKTAQAFGSPFGVEKAGSKSGVITYNRMNHQVMGNRMNMSN